MAYGRMKKTVTDGTRTITRGTRVHVWEDRGVVTVSPERIVLKIKPWVDRDNPWYNYHGGGIVVDANDIALDVDGVHIRTDNKWRDIKYGYELSEKQRAEFDYIDGEDFDWHDFVEYRGVIYDLGDFMSCAGFQNHPQRKWADGWDGYASDSFFSGVLVKYSDDMEQVKMATYTS